jgi:hypothetical protein
MLCSKSANFNINVILKYTFMRAISRLMFHQIIGHCSLAKVTYNINHHIPQDCNMKKNWSIRESASY